MADDELIPKLHEVVNWLFGRQDFARFQSAHPPFDITKPNTHDSKAEFLAEKEIVERLIARLDEIFKIALSDSSSNTHAKASIDRISAFLDGHAKTITGTKSAQSANDLLIKNASELGIFSSCLRVSVVFRQCLRDRQRQLEEQEREFWNISHRPPNYYARTIALRLAKLYAQETGKKPTIGTSSEGDHPSTDFGRALEEIFKLLKIKMRVQRAAEWAIDQLTEEDIKPIWRGFEGPFGASRTPDLTNPYNELVKLLSGEAPEALRK